MTRGPFDQAIIEQAAYYKMTVEQFAKASSRLAEIQELVEQWEREEIRK